MLRKWLAKLITEVMRPELGRLAVFIRKENMSLVDTIIAEVRKIIFSGKAHIPLAQAEIQAKNLIQGIQEHKYSAELKTLEDQAKHLQDLIAQAKVGLEAISKASETPAATTAPAAPANPAPVAPANPAPATPAATTPAASVTVTNATAPTTATASTNTAANPPADGAKAA